jgi:hypothetical protein
MREAVQSSRTRTEARSAVNDHANKMLQLEPSSED